MYKEKGIKQYLSVSSCGKRKDKLSEDEKQAIARKLQDASTDITSYVELCH
jgi:hypothetical protein